MCILRSLKLYNTIVQSDFGHVDVVYDSTSVITKARLQSFQTRIVTLIIGSQSY